LVAVFRAMEYIVHCVTVGFLILAISGLTIVVHHDHPIESGSISSGDQNEAARQPHTNDQETFHEVHILTFVSGDQFVGHQNIDAGNLFHAGRLFSENSSFLYLFIQLYSTVRLTSESAIPPSRDKYALFCSLLI
jgi:hypothetical protein